MDDARWQRRCDRLQRRAEAAELLLEQKSRELFDSNASLRSLARELEARVEARTAQLEEAKDEAQAANRAKSQFLANISHELRTPLNVIIGYAELIADESHEPTVLDHLEGSVGRIRTAGTHLLALVEDILDLSKIEAGRMELQLEDIDVTEVVHDVLQMIEPQMEAGQNQIQVLVPDGTPKVRADRRRLTQCLLNLASNAAKFTEKGRVAIRVLPEPERVRVSVSDTGIGLSDEQVERLFRPFQQAHGQIAGKYGGTGLGLVLSRHMMEIMGGTVVLETTSMGEGTTFALTVPRAA